MRVSNVKSSPRGLRPWVLLPIAGVAIAIAVALYAQFRPPAPSTVSQVIREINAIVLHRSDRPGLEDGGPIGPWWVFAADADPLTGEYERFRLRSGPVHLAARRAQLIVDPESNTIAFDLRDVVLFTLPDPRRKTDLEHHLIELDRYVLGPVPYGRRIVDDGTPLPPVPHIAEVPVE